LQIGNLKLQKIFLSQDEAQKSRNVTGPGLLKSAVKIYNTETTKEEIFMF